MIFKTETIKLFAIAKNLNEFLTEFKLNITSDGLKITEIDSSNVCMLDITLNKESLTEFNFKEKEIYCLNANDFYKVLKDNKKTDVSFSIENNKAIFSFSNGMFPILLRLIPFHDNQCAIFQHK